jgi:hypothetical protein
MKKFGKSNKEMLLLKKDLFNGDEKLLKEQLKIGELYRNQPKRVLCKNCNSKINGEDFVKHKIHYVVCKTCSHLNGVYQDTKEFCEFLYTNDSGENYSQHFGYEEYAKYIEQVNQIYNPKVEFLINSLKEQGEDINKLSYLDFGTGMGHFLKSLRNFNISNIRGFEVSKTCVENGNKFLKENLIEQININNFYSKIGNTDVMSMMGVLEHLENPHEFLSNLKNIKGLKYLYILVPTFSFSSFVELTSQDIFNRQLGSAHTHLYTDSSLKYIEKKFGLERVSEWWFGTDILDLYRHFYLKLEDLESKKMFENYFVDLIDPLQLEIDKQKKSDLIHVLYKLN